MVTANNSSTAADIKEGPTVSVMGDTYRILIGGEQTNGNYSLVDMLIPTGGGPAPHSHPTFQEAFYILEEEINVLTKEKRYTAKQGSYMNIPFNGPIHKFTNETNSVVHFLCFLTPAGLEKMFLEVGKPVTADTLLPIPQLTYEDLKRLQSVAEKYGLILYPLDYFDS